jgi:hypothetical protein
MKITKSQLKEIIKEELEKVISADDLYLAEMFDTGAVDAGGSSLEDKKKQCAAAGGTWEEEGGEYGWCKKPVQETHTRPEDAQRARDLAGELSARRIGSHPEPVRTELVNLFKSLAPELDDEGAKKLAIMVAGLIDAASANIEQDLGLEEGDENWMKGAFSKKKGSLHKALGVPEDKDISVTKMASALRKGGKTEKKARAAVNANPDKYGSIKDVGVEKKKKTKK